jgi:hypothetical protein
MRRRRRRKRSKKKCDAKSPSSLKKISSECGTDMMGGIDIQPSPAHKSRLTFYCPAPVYIYFL